MSRSTKKPYYTDQQKNRPPKGLTSKGRANRQVRAANKKAVLGEIAEEVRSGKAYRRISESWDIRDYSFHCPKDKKASRK